MTSRASQSVRSGDLVRFVRSGHIQTPQGGELGTVLAVLGSAAAPVYRIRWHDGRESFLRGEPALVHATSREDPL